MMSEPQPPPPPPEALPPPPPLAALPEGLNQLPPPHPDGRTNRPPPARPIHGLADGLVMLLWFFAAQLLLGLLLGATGTIDLLNMSESTMAVVGASGQLLAGAGGLAWLKLRNHKLRTLWTGPDGGPLLQPSDMLLGVGTGVVLQLLMMVLLAVWTITVGDPPESGQAIGGTDPSNFGVWLLTATSVAVMAPVLEEMLFRRLLLTPATNKFGTIAAIGGTGLLFGAMHGVTPLYTVLLTAVGIVFATIVHRTGRLAPAVIGHATFNSITLLWMALAT